MKHSAVLWRHFVDCLGATWNPIIDPMCISSFACLRSQYEEAAERRQGINKAVASDVQEVFKGKSASQLAELQKQIERKLRERYTSYLNLIS